MSYETYIELTKKRRSIRKFKPDPLTTAEISKLLEAGRHGPSGFNCQLWEFVVVQKAELRKAIAGFINDALPPKKKVPESPPSGFATAPAFILIYGDPRVRQFAPPHVRAEDDYWEFIFNASLACSFQQIALAAASLGLGSMWVSAFHRMAGVDARTRELLNIPDYLRLYEMMAVGHAHGQPASKSLWPLEKLAHWDKCADGEFRTEGELAEWFGKK